jgi:isoleucyl-tRNA synthetase
MRWMFALQNPENNLLFGYKKADETRRQFHIMLWNIYNFFVTYANIDGFTGIPPAPGPITNILDVWIISRLNQTINETKSCLDKFDAASAATGIAGFVNDLSTWYVRRSRDRVGPAVSDSRDKLFCHCTLYFCLTNLALILAPFTPFISEEIYKTLTGEESVHLAAWPKSPKNTAADFQIIKNMALTRKIVELGLGQRKTSGIKVRQPLALATITCPENPLPDDYGNLIRAELNIKHLKWEKGSELSLSLDINLTPELLAEGKNRELIREVQEARKTAGADLNQQIILTAPLPQNPLLLSELKTKTLAAELVSGETVSVKLL